MAVFICIFSGSLVRRRLFGCQVNAVDSQGLTALHQVAKQGNVQACRLLIQYGADLNIASLQGYTAAQLAPESLQKILKGCMSSIH